MVTPSDNQPIQLDPQTLNFIEEISLHYEKVYDLPRIGCRILAILLFVPEPLSMMRMESWLKVSHASISTNLRLLLAIGYVEKVMFAGDRTAYFRFLPRSRVRILRERINHYQELKHTIQKAEKESSFRGETTDHLKEMVEYAELAIKMNSEFIKEWEQYIRSTK
jgi:DNA-binding transcriptional regulator GbsR (MarR family)